LARPPDPLVAKLLRTGPFYDALRAAIAASGLTLRSVQRRMAARGIVVSVGTLSYWQSGQRTPRHGGSVQAVTTLELVLGLPPASLTGLLVSGWSGPRARPAHSEKPWEELTDSAAEIRSLLGLFGGGIQNRLSVISQHEFVEVGTDRELHRCDNTLVVEARKNVDRYLFTYEADQGSNIDNVSVYARENCRLGRVRRDHEARIVVAELLFDRLLHPGETHVFGYGYADRSPIEYRDVYRGLRFGAEVYVLHVRFNPPALPVRCYRYDTETRLRSDEGGAELFLDPHHMVHTVERGAPPGLYGIRWTWP